MTDKPKRKRRCSRCRDLEAQVDQLQIKLDDLRAQMRTATEAAVTLHDKAFELQCHIAPFVAAAKL